MSPTLSSNERSSLPRLEEDDIVITGLSGLFPDCNSVKEFSEKLYNHENLVTNGKPRWEFEHPELTQHCGVVPDLGTFDAQFFMVHYHLASNMDAMSRKLLEHAYQAIFDAGISPNQLSGTNMGVFIATHLTETETFSAYTAFGFGIAGCNRAMFSNRISYLLNVNGPSVTIDAGCSGTLVCLEKAYEALWHGDCETAIVGGCNIHLHPHSCINYGRMFPINKDGKTKCFDKNADGQSQSECISILFLQRAKCAKRIYATVCDVKSEFAGDLSGTGFFDTYGPVRAPSRLSSFYNKFYSKGNISPLDVEYIEAFGAASPEADKAELEAIQDVFCKNRKDPLLIGSVMSNMGYSQAATAAAALTKVCLAYHTGQISANLHYETPHDIPAISDGRMRVVTKNQPFRRSYTALNSMSLTGLNGHVLLKGRYKPKDVKRYESMIPHLLTISGRQELAVKAIFDDVKSRPLDPEEIALYHNIHKTRVTKHLARGFTILKTDENQKTVSVKEKIDYYDDALRPLWFVYSGMGSQWNGMGKELMRIPLFAAVIHRCQAVLKPKGVDLIHILTSDDKKLFDNILNSFVGIAAVQIGLTDLLLKMGFEPDHIIGHSVGELACAYADGCLTVEQVILAAYYRGLVSLETPMIKGSMAAVGLGWQQIQAMCPDVIDVACHNAAGSSTISGPAEDLNNFVDTLNKQGIFAREVNCCNIAYHSRYIQDAGPLLLKNLKNVIKDPKPRSHRWLSTSVPKSGWDKPAAQLCSAEYHTNNLLSPVLFEETSEAIPANAVLIEVAPHGLLQAILRRALPPSCTNIPLTRREHSNNAQYLLEAIGELYMSGYSPDLSILYPQIEFPVSTETRPLAQLVKWEHTENWKLPVYVADDRQYAAAYDVTLSSHDDEFSFLEGHIIDDQTVFPFAGALTAVWDTLAMATKKKRKELSVHFKEIHFHNQPPLFENRLMKLSVEIHKGDGRFQVVNEDVLVVTGFIKAELEMITSEEKKEYEAEKSFKMMYNYNGIYRMFYDKGYEYRGEFRSIHKVNAEKSCALVAWNDNWVTFIDAVIQMNALRSEGDMVEQPRFIQSLFINIKEHKFAIQSLKKGVGYLEAHYYQHKRATRCGGVALKNCLFGNITSNQKKHIGLKTLQFIPYYQQKFSDVSSALYIILQIIEENIDNTMNALDLTENENGSLLGNKIKQLLSGISSIKLNMKKTTKKDMVESNNLINPDFIVVDLIMDKRLNELLAHAIQPHTFLIVLEETSVAQSLYKVLVSFNTPVGRLVLGLWRPQRTNNIPSVIPVTAAQDINKLKMTRNTMASNGTLYILSQYPPIEELKSLVVQWRKEQKKNKVYVAMVDKTSIKNLEAKQLPDFDLAYSVLHNGQWGGYYYTCDIKADETSSKQQAVTLRSAQNGDLDSLQWIKSPERNAEDIVVTVHYAGLNFYDAKKAVGDNNLSPDDVSGQHYGMDFSGVTARNERVMGIVSGGAAASKVAAQPSLLWPVPEHWTLEDAATVPLAYAHAYYCFGMKCQLIAGMSVLIHGGAGALGQAAISIALANRCTVFTTVSDIKKKRFLLNMFPELKETNIGCSRDSTFGDTVMDVTRGVGCDIILSCVKGELKNTTLSCCASNGTTLDIQEIHSKESYIYGMHSMTKCRSYVLVDFSAIFRLHNTDVMKQLQLMVSDGIVNGEVRPLSRLVYRAEEAARALRLLAASRHRGKVLLHIHGEPVLVTKRLTVQPNGSCLVLASSPDDTIAIRVVDMLIARGATNIILRHLKKKELTNNVYSFMDDKMNHWQKLGAKVETTYETLRGVAKVEELIHYCNSLGPLDGIYMIVDSPDHTMVETLSNLFSTLDNVSRRLCPATRYFAVINNESDIGRYICMNRKLDGLPALMLQIENIDKLNEKRENFKDISTKSDSISLRKVMPFVEKALCLSEPVAKIYTYDKGVLLDKICEITNLDINNESNHTMTLHELGLKAELAQELYDFLQSYEVVVKKEEVPLLTVGKLKALQNNLDKSRALSGLEVLYTYRENDEILSSYELIFLPTLSQQSTMYDDGIDTNASYLVLVPGMDGHYGKFQSLCERLKLSAVVCQPGFDHPHESIPQTAERLVQVLLKKIHPKGKMYLLGYSYGVLVALEMAAILEKLDMTGVVFCVDASPDTFPTAMDTWLREAGLTDDALLETAIVQHIAKLMIGQSSPRLALELQRTTNWKDRVEAGLRALKERGHSLQYARNVLETTYARIIQTRQYDSKRFQPLRSQVILLRCGSNFALSSDLGLSRFSKLKPLVYDLLADHANALQDIRCANIVNRHLDKSILDDFQNKNRCITYTCSNSHPLNV